VQPTKSIDPTSMSGYDKNQQYVYGKWECGSSDGFTRAPATLGSDAPVRAHVSVLVLLADHHPTDAEATRSNQVPSYTGIAQPSFDSQFTEAPARLAHEPTRTDMPYLSNPTYESRAVAEHQPGSSFIDAGSRHPVSATSAETEISEYVSPTQGTAGSTVSLQLRTNYDLALSQNTYILMFGSKKCVAELQKVDYNDQWFNYLLNVEVPPFSLTNTLVPTMMLKLQIEDKNGHLRSQWDAGKFTFTDMSPNLAYQSSPDYSRKRKYSTEYGDAQDYADSSATKRINTMRSYVKPRSMSGAYSTAQISPLPSQSSLATYGGGFDMSRQTSYASQLSQKGLFAVPSGMSLPQTDFKLPQMSPSLQPYGHYSPVPQTGRNPLSMTINPAGSSIYGGSAVLPAPVLVRATTLPQAGSHTPAQPFNPYSVYQSKAVLKIEGDLEKMSEEWSEEELDAKRRLVEFKRAQHGSTITATFAAVTPEARPTRSICVSCIWWEDKDECFITSVDTIYLLEQLVNVRFTVEEKNRIRRNLEGFRPSTVSKAKPDSEDFFKVIMGFPTPKPRNIEKDVKVFPWKVLAQALKKIISKYVCIHFTKHSAKLTFHSPRATRRQPVLDRFLSRPHRLMCRTPCRTQQ
jgi:hypothetical protein